jgi:hypothetical protein
MAQCLKAVHSAQRRRHSVHQLRCAAGTASRRHQKLPVFAAPEVYLPASEGRRVLAMEFLRKWWSGKSAKAGRMVFNVVFHDCLVVCSGIGFQSPARLSRARFSRCLQPDQDAPDFSQFQPKQGDTQRVKAAAAAAAAAREPPILQEDRGGRGGIQVSAGSAA